MVPQRLCAVSGLESIEACGLWRDRTHSDYDYRDDAVKLEPVDRFRDGFKYGRSDGLGLRQNSDEAEVKANAMIVASSGRLARNEGACSD